MEDKKSWKTNLKHAVATVTSTLVHALQNSDFDSNSDSSVSNSMFSDSVVASNVSDTISALLNLSLPSPSETSNIEGITLIWYDPRLGKTEDTKQTAK